MDPAGEATLGVVAAARFLALACRLKDARAFTSSLRRLVRAVRILEAAEVPAG